MKEIKCAVKMKLPENKAKPTPPVSTILGPSGIDIIKFCDDFNNWSKDLNGEVEFGVIVYSDLSYDILSKEQFNQYQTTQLNDSLSFLYKNQEENQLKTR